MSKKLKTVLIWVRNFVISSALAILCCYGALGVYVLIFGLPEDIEYVYAFLWMLGVPIVLAVLDSKKLYEIKFTRKQREQQEKPRPLDPETAALMLTTGVYCLAPGSFEGETVDAGAIIATSEKLQFLQNHFVFSCEDAGIPTPDRLPYLLVSGKKLENIIPLINDYLKHRERQTEDMMGLITPEEDQGD